MHMAGGAQYDLRCREVDPVRDEVGLLAGAGTADSARAATASTRMTDRPAPNGPPHEVL